jgi:hypothetical protein
MRKWEKIFFCKILEAPFFAGDKAYFLLELNIQGGTYIGNRQEGIFLPGVG